MRRPLALLQAACGLLAVLTLARLPAAWESGNALNHVGGAWMTLADDLAHGTLYRPLHDPQLGFGGTRNFPLVFAIHAALIRAGVPVLAAGYAVSAAAGLLAALGAALLLRRSGLHLRDAGLLAPAALAGLATQQALTASRGDLLPVALTALGLAVLLAPHALRPAQGERPEARQRRLAVRKARRGWGRVLLAAALLSLAFAAKVTALTGLLAGVAFLALRGERRDAWRLALLGAGLSALWLGATQLLSGGRFLPILWACASGGADLGTALSGPIRMLFHLCFDDRPGLVLLLGAVTAAVATRPRAPGGWRRPEAAALLLCTVWLALAVGTTGLVFGSPGTGPNHFVELEVASVAVLGAALARVVRAPERWTRWRRRVVLGAGLSAAAAGLASAGLVLHQDRSESRLDQVRAAIAALPPGAAMLSEDPLVPLLAGQRPLVLDPWMLRLVAERDPAITAPLVQALGRGWPPAVVLMQPVEEPLSYPHPRHLGTPVFEAIQRSYRFSAEAGLYRLYAFARPAAKPGDVVMVGPAPAGEPPAAGRAAGGL